MKKLFDTFTILYAEDDSDMLNSYANYLETLFQDVYKANDGLEAYKLYKKHLPDILLLDISMPEIDGLTLSQKIREHDTFVKIILLTAHGDQEKLLSAVKLNLVDYLLKPIKRGHLLEVLTQAVQEHKNANREKKPYCFKEKYVWYGDVSRLYYDGKLVHLTNKESILLDCLTSNPYLNFSITTIVDYYANKKISMSENAVRSVIKRVKSKLPKNTIINEFGIGYKINDIK